MSDNYIIFLNGRPVLSAVAANEKEGWVDIIDPARMAPLSLEKEELPNLTDELPAPTEILTKRLYGKVEIKKVVR